MWETHATCGGEGEFRAELYCLTWAADLEQDVLERHWLSFKSKIYNRRKRRKTKSCRRKRRVKGKGGGKEVVLNA